VIEHTGMKEILVYGRELILQLGIQMFDDCLIAFHGWAPCLM
jgi:hypothetical protein